MKTLFPVHVSAAQGAVAIGTALAWTSPVLPILKDANTTIFEQPIDSVQESMIGSLIAIGAIVGALPAGEWGRNFTWDGNYREKGNLNSRASNLFQETSISVDQYYSNFCMGFINV